MREYLVSYAQEIEDIVLYHVLKDVENVFWIDVGANDPIYINVSYFFYRRGGRGINIEPQIEYKDRYELLRPQDQLLSIGIAQKSGTMKLYGDGVGASFEVEEGLEYVEVPVCSLDEVCSKYVPGKKDIHFLKIDVELYEREVLLSVDLNVIRPWVIVVESISNGRNTYEEWENILLEAGYLFVYQDPDGLNRYYVANERDELINRFVGHEELYKEYYIVNYNSFMKNPLDRPSHIKMYLTHNPIVDRIKEYFAQFLKIK